MLEVKLCHGCVCTVQLFAMVCPWRLVFECEILNMSYLVVDGGVLGLATRLTIANRIAACRRGVALARCRAVVLTYCHTGTC